MGECEYRGRKSTEPSAKALDVCWIDDQRRLRTTAHLRNTSQQPFIGCTSWVSDHTSGSLRAIPGAERSRVEAAPKHREWRNHFGTIERHQAYPSSFDALFDRRHHRSHRNFGRTASGDRKSSVYQLAV